MTLSFVTSWRCGIACCLSIALSAGLAIGQETDVSRRLDEVERRLQELERVLGNKNLQRYLEADQEKVEIFAVPEALPKRTLLSEQGRSRALANDTDQDGLTDAEEVQLETDPANADTDGDGLLDGWEVHGVNGIDLRAKGASPRHKDIFVEMDFMQRSSATNGLGPHAGVMRAIQIVFERAPVSNPDQQQGIKLHLELGNPVPHDADLHPVFSEFRTIKLANFDPSRAPVFHYMIWADGYSGRTSSGLSFGIPHSDFIVTLGRWNGGKGGTDLQKIGTFLHELGHNLGLKHGGSDHIGRKPNHLSVMNYLFQTIGILVNGQRQFDFQRFSVPTLREVALDENFGLGRSESLRGFHTRFRSINSFLERPASGALDWDVDNQIDGLPVAIDLNGDTLLNDLRGTPAEWTQLIYNGGSVGSLQSLQASLQRADDTRTVLPVVELTEEMDQAYR